MFGGGGVILIGVMAACIVLFVPMGMAGWHLSRNKMLFFSGTLFITLAVVVHLSPFFPSSSSSSFSSYFFSSSSPSLSDSVLVLENHPQPPPPPRDSCFSFLHHIVFNNNNSNISWDWGAAANSSIPLLACQLQKLGRSDASDLLNGSWIVVAGDSQARFLALSVLHLLLPSRADLESVKADLFKRHSNYQIFIPHIAMKLDFIWAPFVSNLTHLILEFNHNHNINFPDVLVLGSGLWHLLHITNDSDYGFSLQVMRDSLLSSLPISPESASVSIRSPHLFWLGMPLLINSMLNSVDKREKMSIAAYHAYHTELYKSNLLRQQSDGPLLLLNMLSLSRSCGARCTTDGMHYHEAVYEAALHIMLNALLLESHQKL